VYHTHITATQEAQRSLKLSVGAYATAVLLPLGILQLLLTFFARPSYLRYRHHITVFNRCIRQAAFLYAWYASKSEDHYCSVAMRLAKASPSSSLGLLKFQLWVSQGLPTSRVLEGLCVQNVQISRCQVAKVLLHQSPSQICLAHHWCNNNAKDMQVCLSVLRLKTHPKVALLMYVPD
jgi:hypothetical protein